jgi:phage terminase small subunit
MTKIMAAENGNHDAAFLYLYFLKIVNKRQRVLIIMPAHRKIDEREFLELLDNGMHPAAIARHFNVTPAAITKKLKKYRPSPAVQKYTRKRKHDEEPEASGKRYSEKKALYVEARLDGKKPTQAAMVAYDCKSPESAKVIGSNLENDPLVKRAITDCLLDVGVTPGYRASKIKTILDGDSVDYQLRALDHTAKLCGDYTVKVEIESVDYHVIREDIRSIEDETTRLRAELARLEGFDDHKVIDITPSKKDKGNENL